MKTEAHAMKKTRTSLIQGSITLKKKEIKQNENLTVHPWTSIGLSLVIWYSIKVLSKNVLIK